MSSRKRIHSSLVVSIAACALGPSVSAIAAQPVIKTFEAPGAGKDGYSGQGTFPQGINDLGEVSGFYADVNSIYHGFVRTASGSITTFDVPTTCTTAVPPADCAFEGTFPSRRARDGLEASSAYTPGHGAAISKLLPTIELRLPKTGMPVHF